MVVHDKPTLTDISSNTSFSTVALFERGISTELMDSRGLTFMPLVSSYDCAFLDIKNDNHSFIRRFWHGDSIHLDTDTLPDGNYKYVLFLKDCVLKEKEVKKSKTQEGTFRVSAGVFGSYTPEWE